MTGTEPENGASTRPGLARSLFRVSLPRWRGGQYSLSKLFFNFYFLAMGSFIAIAIVADFIITTAQQGITDDYSRRFMRGTITLIEDELHRHPRRQWAEQIKVIDEKFYYRLGIVERRSLDSRLASAQIDKLDSGDIAISHDRELIYLGTEVNEFAGILKAQIDTMSGQRMDAVCRVANQRDPRGHRLRNAHQPERKGGCRSDRFECSQLILSRLADASGQVGTAQV